MKHQEFYTEVGNRIKNAREARNKSQDDIAKFLAIPRPSITNIELGKQRITLFDLLKLSKHLDYDFWLFIPEELYECNHIWEAVPSRFGDSKAVCGKCGKTSGERPGQRITAIKVEEMPEHDMGRSLYQPKKVWTTCDGCGRGLDIIQSRSGLCDKCFPEHYTGEPHGIN